MAKLNGKRISFLVSKFYIYYLIESDLDFEAATGYDEKYPDDDSVVPVHDNVIKNFANMEIYDAEDENKEDCLGWITIMEKCDRNLREKLKKGNPTLEERKKIAKGIEAGLKYLKKVGIWHFDKKLANFLLIGDVAKVCDFGLVEEKSGRSSYRKLGYTRKGSKYRNLSALCKFWFLNNFHFDFRFRNTWIYGTRSTWF